MSPPLPPLAVDLFELARQLEEYMNERTEQLDFESYETLLNWESRLLAYANLLSAADPERFIKHEQALIVSGFADLRDRLGEVT